MEGFSLATDDQMISSVLRLNDKVAVGNMSIRVREGTGKMFAMYRREKRVSFDYLVREYAKIGGVCTELEEGDVLAVDLSGIR